MAMGWLFEMTLLILVLRVYISDAVAKNALLIIDVQDCFLKGGSLAVEGGNDIIPIINDLRDKYKDYWNLVVFSQDWHCVDHVSFASQHAGFSPYDKINLTYNDKGQLCIGGIITNSNPYAVTCQSVDITINQNLWPDHCIANVSTGPTSSDLDPHLQRESSDVIIYKGTQCDIDAYSAFYDNGKLSQTDLNSKLQANGITDVFVTGLATDFCVYYTSKDAKSLNYNTFVVTDATRGVANVTVEAALQDMANRGIKLIKSSDVGGYLTVSGCWQLTSAMLPLYVSFLMLAGKLHF